MKTLHPPVSVGRRAREAGLPIAAEAPIFSLPEGKLHLWFVLPNLRLARPAATDHFSPREGSAARASLCGSLRRDLCAGTPALTPQPPTLSEASPHSAIRHPNGAACSPTKSMSRLGAAHCLHLPLLRQRFAASVRRCFFLDAGLRGRRVPARHCRTKQSHFCCTRSHPVTPSPLGTLVPLLRGGLVPALEHQVQSSGFYRLTGWGESSDGAHSLGSWCLERRHDPATQPGHRSFPGHSPSQTERRDLARPHQTRESGGCGSSPCTPRRR